MPKAAGWAGFIRTALAALNYRPTATDLSGTTQVDLVGPVTVNYVGELEEFGFVPDTTLTGGPQVYGLVDAAGVQRGAITVTAAAPKAIPITKRNFTEAQRQLLDGTTLTIRRTSGGTAISAGGGTFYVVTRQRMQGRA